MEGDAGEEVGGERKVRMTWGLEAFILGTISDSRSWMLRDRSPGVQLHEISFENLKTLNQKKWDVLKHSRTLLRC